ncbi:hypothetical protein EZV76_16270 [Flagellimonas alvinocaridis]|uniref:Uncharacterized protein n=1 Tax=Flagellimonas alvinocaridis TaxID=2530200 RepID=A0A4S8RGH0_9FLAO|nr:hypothetical protein [Allomuricauda alvinocaridis]THV57000.1 hypothetical protein EZV76_16270 [Allomuricauda alvinocaridis]
MTVHSFHIPVMGIAFTIDSPLKVAPFGIDSSISLVDDILLEKMRKMYCERFEIPYHEISENMHDFRARRIKSYLDLIKEHAEKKFEQIKDITHGMSEGLKQYLDMLPNTSSLKKRFKAWELSACDLNSLKRLIDNNLSMGNIEVNIMTKLDRENYRKKVSLGQTYNDAHAALRGFAKSNLNSFVVFSAGMNPRLYGYIEEFEDFFPNEKGFIKKKITLKVSDYRSALIQGKFLAKKGLWVSEYRIESGLNCGGHAFATEGHLIGPILAQFRDQKQALITETHSVLVQALSQKKRNVPRFPLPVKISAQGGVGTAEEHQFLLDHYKLDSVGWGTPFLLVPEATTVDDQTMAKLSEAKEKDLYLSNISPLGVPFNSLKGNTKDLEKKGHIAKGRPGSPCPKKYVALNKEFTNEGICTASRQYQHLKLEELENMDLPVEKYQETYEKIVEKSCACVGLGTSALLKYGLDTKTEGKGVSICPGPNMAYFSKITGLREMTRHIYGESSLIDRTDRPNMFIKELHLYVTLLKTKLKETETSNPDKKIDYLLSFSENLKKGIAYYRSVFVESNKTFKKDRVSILKALHDYEHSLARTTEQILNLKT